MRGIPSRAWPLAAAGAALAAAPATAQEPAPVPAALAAELVDAGQPLRGTDAPTVFVGRLPDGFRAVPLPAGARVLGGAAWKTGSSVALLRLDTPSAQARAQAFAALDAAGWKALTVRTLPFPDPDYPRFVASTPPDPERDAIRCAPGDSSGAVVVGARAREGYAVVRLLALSAARAARCRPPQPIRLTADRPRRAPLPHLPPPAGVRVEAEFGTETGSNEATATGRVLPDSATGALPNAAAVLAHYARVLASGGWTAAVVPGWDTTRATPLFVSPPDSTGARWVAAVDARPDTGRGAASAVTGRTGPSLALRLRVSQLGAGAPDDRGIGMVGWSYNSYGTVSGTADVDVSTDERRTGRDTTRAPRRLAGPPVSRELVTALLAGEVAWIENARVGDHLTDGRPPAGWSAPIPNAAGARVLGGWGWGEPGGAFGQRWVLVAVAPGAPAAVARAYGRQLDRAGWRTMLAAAEDLERLRAGFQSSPASGRPSHVPRAHVFRCTPAGASLEGTASDRAFGAGSLLRLTLTRTEGAGCGAEAGEVRALRRYRAPVPPLAVPAGFLVQGGLGSGSAIEWQMTATVRGAASPAAVVDSGAKSPASASDAALQTMLAGPQEWSGLLSTARRPDGGYTATLEVRRTLGRER